MDKTQRIAKDAAVAGCQRVKFLTDRLSLQVLHRPAHGPGEAIQHQRGRREDHAGQTSGPGDGHVAQHHSNRHRSQ